LISAISSSWRPTDIPDRAVVSRDGPSVTGPVAAADAVPAIDKDNPMIPTAGTTSLRRFPLDVRGTASSVCESVLDKYPARIDVRPRENGLA